QAIRRRPTHLKPSERWSALFRDRCCTHTGETSGHSPVARRARATDRRGFRRGHFGAPSGAGGIRISPMTLLQSPIATLRLAIDGGEPIVPEGYVMMSRWPRLDRADLDAVIRQLETGLYTEMSSFAQVCEFESEMAVVTGTRFGLALNSGT